MSSLCYDVDVPQVKVSDKWNVSGEGILKTNHVILSVVHALCLRLPLHYEYSSVNGVSRSFFSVGSQRSWMERIRFFEQVLHGYWNRLLIRMSRR